MSVISNLQGITNALKEATKATNDLTAAWKTMGTAASSSTRGASVPGGGGFSSGGIGHAGLGVSSPIMTNPASFSGLAGIPGFMASAVSGPMARIGLGLAKIPASFAAGAYAALPSAGTIVSRAAGYYGSAYYSSGSRAALENRTLSMMGANGLTSPVGDVLAANTLTQQFNYGPDSLGYNQTMREVGGLARSLNMGNAQAAAALGGMQTGGMAGNLYQYGISTWNMAQNRPMTTGEIAKQMFSLVYQNRKPTAKTIQEDLQRGALGYDMTQAFGLSPDQVQIYKQAFMNIAQGKNPDLASSQNVAAQTAKGNNNVMLSQYGLNTSQAQLMGTAEAGTVQGFDAANKALTSLTNSMKGLPEDVFKFKAALETFLGSSVGQGAATAAGGTMNALLNIGQGGMELALLSKMLGKGAVSTGVKDVFASTVGKGANLLKGGAAAAAGNIVGGAIQANTSQGSIGHRLGSAAQWAGNVFAATSFLNLIPGVDLATGAAAGVAGLIGAAVGGGNSGFGASFGPSGGAFSVEAPVNAAPTVQFGAKNPKLWKNGHTGQDYPVPTGTPVHAAADGVVMSQDPGSAYGINVMIDHGNGYQTLYGHLSEKSVSPNDTVSKGQVIGKSGATGNVTGPHLHFEVRKGNNNPVDPQQFLSGNVGASPAATQAKVSGLSGSAGSFAAFASPYDAASALGTNYDAASSLGVIASLTGAAVPSGITGSPGGSSAKVQPATLVKPSGSKAAWARQFLSSLNMPMTASNLSAVATWMAYEGGNWNNSAKFNPLNTTQPEQGASSMNSEGVKAYTSWAQGLAATVQTIRNGRYGNILSALQQGNDAGSVLSAVNHSPWGTKIPGYGGGNPGFGASIGGVSNGSGVVNNTFNFTVQVANGSDAEAEQLARKVRSILESDKRMTTLKGR